MRGKVVELLPNAMFRVESRMVTRSSGRRGTFRFGAQGDIKSFRGSGEKGLLAIVAASHAHD